MQEKIEDPKEEKKDILITENSEIEIIN